MPDPTPAQRLQLTLPPFRLRPHVPRPPSLRLNPPVSAAGHDVRSFPFLPPLDLAPPLERQPASSFDPFRRWPLPALEPDPLTPTEPPQLGQPEPLAVYNFNQTQQADEPANRGTAEALLGFSRTAGQNQSSYTLLGRQSYSHGALGLTMSGDSGLGLRSIGAVGHLWRSVVEGAAGDDDAFKLTIGAYGQGTLGSIPAPLGAVGSNTGTVTGAGSFDWGWLSLDLNAVGIRGQPSAAQRSRAIHRRPGVRPGRIGGPDAQVERRLPRHHGRGFLRRTSGSRAIPPAR